MDKEKLVSILDQSDAKLKELQTIPYDGLHENITELESIFSEFRQAGEELLTKSDTLQIGIVGQVKAGKSSFLNSLFFNGEDVLPKASTPMTAGLTIIEHSDKNTFEVEYFDEKDWSIFVNQDEEYKKREKEVREQNQGAPESIIRKELESRTSEKVRSAHEMVSECSSQAKMKIGSENDIQDFLDIDDLQNVLEQYVGANGEYTSVVKSLYIKMNDERLIGLRIVDTPGVNDPVVSRENRTRTFLQSCHGVFLLSASTDFLGSGDISFLNTRIGGSGIGSVVLLASKFDSVLQDIGADHEMKGEERSDLVDEIEIQTKKFKRRLRDLSETINENLRGKIRLDTTAGIGYSIAKKNSGKWDNVERQVVQQMRRYYPDYFTDEKDLVESFMGLANIDDIREKYLDGVFMKNKEQIISDKVNGFFIKNKENIRATISHILDEYTNRQKQLNDTTIEEIRKQRVMQQKLFQGLQTSFSDIFNGFSNTIQSEIKRISNNVRFDDIRRIPTEFGVESITHKGRLWGHNTNDFEIEHVNTFSLQTQIVNAVEKYGKDWNNEWKKLFDNARRELADKLNKTIGNFEMQIKSSSFDDFYYRTLIDRSLDNLKKSKELDIGDIITEYQRQGEDIANNQFYPYGTDDLKKSEVESYLSRKLREHNAYLISQFRNLADSIKEDVKTEVNVNLDNAIKIIDGMKIEFSQNLQKEGDEYLAQLEEEMKEKTSVLEKINSIIIIVNELASLYK